MTTVEHRIDLALKEKFHLVRDGLAHYKKIILEYYDSKLSPPHLVEEIETGDEGKFWSCIWEAMLFKHLASLGYEPKNNSSLKGQDGPDFYIEHQTRRIWIEAIVPSPIGIPAEWLKLPGPGEVRKKPDQPRVLRCASAIWDKQKKFADYKSARIVGSEDCLVIAVSICRLSDWDFDGNGVSQRPLVMEALFPIGPISYSINCKGKIEGPAQHVSRFKLKKLNGSGVPTTPFYDPAFASISAVMQGHQKDMFSRGLDLAIVHNPNAIVPLPVRILGARKEFVAEEGEENYMITEVALARDA